MIEVYHTSNVIVEHPDTKHSRKDLDFEPGFYFTSIRHQAFGIHKTQHTILHSYGCYVTAMFNL